MNERNVLNIEARARDGELFNENFYLKVSKSIDTNDRNIIRLYVILRSL